MQASPLSFSVITPSLNQAAFIEQTIRSVAGQNYPQYEHIVIDGGSTDGTLAILKKYPHLNWVSEKDAGQADALNKGLRKATGDIVAWINSDDWYEPNAFEAVADFFHRNPDKSIVMGDCHLVDENGNVFDTVVNGERGFDELKRYWVGRSIPTQPAIFFRRTLLAEFGLLDPALHYAMDYDLWLRFAQCHRFFHLDRTVANYRFHRGAKGGDQNWSKFLPEWKAVSDRYPCAGVPLVTVVIPCFNYGCYLAEALDSVIQQTYRRLEIIIVNDGSTDSTADVAADFIRRHPNCRVRLINQENSGQPAISRNKGIGEASGALILPLDADDALAPSMIGECVELLDHDPAVAIAYTDRQDFDGASRIVAAGDYDFAKLRYANQISYCALFRKEVWSRVGGYRTNVKGLEDWDFWIAAGLKGFTGRRIPKSLFKYRRHDRGVYQEAVRGFARKFAQIVLNNREAYLPGDIEKAERILEPSSCDRPEVSVIIPTFNRPDMLAEAVRSVLAQTSQNLEIIVVNDAGVDVSPVIGRCGDSRIRLVSHSENRGLAAARNTGIRGARGTYIALLDDDDLFYPEHLETALQVLHAGWKVAYTDAVRAVFARKGDRYELRRKHVPYSMDFDRSKLLIGNIAPVNCFVFEKELALKAGLFDETLSTLEDWDLWLRLSALAPFHHIQQQTVQVNWRTDGSTMTSSRQSEFKRNRARIYGRHQSEINAIPNRDAIIAEFNAIWSQDFAGEGGSDPRPTPRRRLVSIIVLTFNQLSHTRNCVASIRRHTPEAHEIVLVDNGSTDGTLPWLRELVQQDPDCRLIENGRNLGFAAGNNQGIRAARGDYLVLLNNDVVVTPRWLARMLACAESDPATGVVGPKSNQTSGPQRMPAIGYDPVSLEGLDKFATELSERHGGKSLPHWKVVGFCMLVKRQVIDRIGGLDPRFGIGNFEDDDFCLRARLAGFKARIAEDAYVHHVGGASFKAADLDYSKLLQTNWDVFKQKWELPAETTCRGGYTLSLKDISFKPVCHYVPLEDSGDPGLQGFPTMPEPGRRVALHPPSDSIELLMPTHQPMAPSHHPHGGQNVNNYEQMYDNIQPLLRSSRLEDAVNALQNVVGSFPEFARGHNDLGVLYVQMGEKEKALGHLERAVLLRPQNSSFRKNLADFYFTQMGRTEDAVRLYEEVLQSKPGDKETLMTTAHLLVALKRFENAKGYYQQVLAIEPWNAEARDNLAKLQRIASPPVEIPSCEALYQKALKAVEQGDPAGAMRQLEHLTGVHPEFALAHNDLGVLYYQSSQKERALQRYEEAARLEPANITFIKNLADFYYVEQGRVEDALRLYIRVLEGHPEDIETLMATARICNGLQLADDARVFYERILEIEPWNSEACGCLDQLSTPQPQVPMPSQPQDLHADAMRLSAEGKPEEAKNALERLIAQHPDSALAHNDLGILYYQSGDKQQALRHYERAAQLDRSNLTFLKNLADCYWVEFGRLEEALRIYVEVLSAHPSDIEALYATGRVCVELKQYDDARVFFEKALEIEPWNADARQQLDQLESASQAA